MFWTSVHHLPKDQGFLFSRVIFRWQIGIIGFEKCLRSNKSGLFDQTWFFFGKKYTYVPMERRYLWNFISVVEKRLECTRRKPVYLYTLYTWI